MVSFVGRKVRNRTSDEVIMTPMERTFKLRVTNILMTHFQTLADVLQNDAK